MTQVIINEINRIKSIISHNIPYSETNLGKMVRSKIGLLYLKMLDIDTAKYLDFFSAIELIHNASLLHDDVLDNETQRRGKENLKYIYDNKTSILYGNILLSNALHLISDYKNIELINLFNKTISDMCKGELQQKGQIGCIPTIDEYIEKSRLKTASLFEFVFSGVNTLSNNIYNLPVEFGTNFGVAFQIKNDLDNILNSKSDIDNGVYTAPVIYSNSINITMDGIEKTKCLIDNYRGKCINHLYSFSDCEYKVELIGVVECLKK